MLVRKLAGEEVFTAQHCNPEQPSRFQDDSFSPIPIPALQPHVQQQECDGHVALP